MDRFRSLACDITNHCNNRCVFCFNWWDKPALMEENIFKIIINHMYDYVKDWILISCLFEPTLHPHFLDFMEYIPKNKKDKIFFTSNISRKFSDGYFYRMAQCNFHHINISLETLDENKYKFITKNSQGNFYRNLKMLVDEFAKVRNHPYIRFITMVTRDNKDEILAIARFAKEECGVYQHEFRTPYFSPFLPKNWLLNNTLSRDELNEIRDKLQDLGYEGTTCGFEFDAEKYREIISQGNYCASYPNIQVYSDDNSKEWIPYLQTGIAAFPRINARGYFTADELEYAYNLNCINDYDEFIKFVAKKINIKAKRKHFQEKFKN